jgi:cytochrome c
VKALTDPETPRSTLMKLARVSTLWDYINRAMPWTAPKTLTTEEVYAVTAFILSMGDIVPEDFVLSDRNITEVQGKLPNRDGLTREHGLWSVRGRPDVKNVACMKNCVQEVKVTSELPEQAKDAHGNLADQTRVIGPVRGIRTVSVTNAQSTVGAAASKSPNTSARDLANSSGCLACHGVSNKLVGPALTEIGAKYHGQADASRDLVRKVKQGGSGVWGAVPMPPQAHLKDDDIKAMVAWILGGAK